MIPGNLTFESYIRVAASECAYRLCRSVASPSARTSHVVLLHGPTGTGKTHLLGATAVAFGALHPGRRVVVTTAHEFRYELVEAIRHDSVNDFHRTYYDVALLAIDDLHALVDRPGTQDAMARSISTCVAAGMRVIGAATAPPRAIEVFRSVLAKDWRVRQCEIDRFDQRDIRHILTTIATRRSITISSSTLTRIARHSAGDVRRALGALTHVDAMSVLPGAPREPVWMAKTAHSAR